MAIKGLYCILCIIAQLESDIVYFCSTEKTRTLCDCNYKKINPLGRIAGEKINAFDGEKSFNSLYIIIFSGAFIVRNGQRLTD